MAGYINRRLLQGLVVIILVSLFIFFIMRLLPGDPLMVYITENDLRSMTQQQINELRHELGLDKPMVAQYVDWVAGLFHGDLGTSIFYRENVGKLILERFPITLHLGLFSLIVGAILGTAVGLVAALRRGKWTDKILTPLTYIGITIPAFWLGILLIYGLGLKLHWLPIAGYTSPFKDFWLSTRQLVMPVICLSVFGLAANARQMRSSMLEVIRKDYIRTAWAKGLSERAVILKHALKNSLIPVITLIGIGVGHIFGGAVLIETVFAIPGLGRLLASSIFGHDYVVVQAITLLIALTVLIMNLIVDLSYGWFDPRIRYS